MNMQEIWIYEKAWRLKQESMQEIQANENAREWIRFYLSASVWECVIKSGKNLVTLFLGNGEMFWCF